MITRERVRAAAYRAAARLLVKSGEHSAAAILNARAVRLLEGVPEAMDSFQGVNQ